MASKSDTWDKGHLFRCGRWRRQGGNGERAGERFFKKADEKTKVRLNKVVLMWQPLKNLWKSLLTE